MKDLKINKFIFSSSAAVYGEPEHIPVTELHPFNPVNPYGDTKAEVENILKSIRKINRHSIGFYRKSTENL